MPLRVRMVLAGGEGERAPRALALLLDLLTRVNCEILSSPDGARVPALYRAGVRYVREDYEGTHPEDWRDCLEVLRRGGGDCEDLAAWRVAELRIRGGEPRARCVFAQVPRPSGGRLFHIIVERQDGALEDPSRELGMGRTY